MVPLNETLINKLGMHEAAYYLLKNDKVIQINFVSYKSLNSLQTVEFKKMVKTNSYFAEY